MAEENDSDWEYEYHETETESFYVTLDLSSASSSYRPKKQEDISQPKQASASRANNSSGPVADAPDATTQQDEANLDAANDTIQLDEEVLDAPDATIQQDGENIDEAEPATDPSDRIQILDLHSPNPIISYRNQIYSCEWTSTIGTDVLLTTPDPDFPHPILKQERGVSVLAMTSIKLFGRPAQVATRDGKEATSAPATSTAAADTTRVPAPATQVKIPVNSSSKKARHNQAKFLERLIAIKAAKGEKDEVTVYAQKPEQCSTKPNPMQEQPASGDANVDADMDDGSAPATPIVRRGSDRSRGVRRRRGLNPRARGGLFRDYRQQTIPTEGADTEFQPSATPHTWYQPAPSRTGDDGNSIVQPPAATSFSTSPPLPPPGYHPQTSRPRTDLPNTDRTSIDIVPNVLPDPDAASKNPDVYPMKPSAPLTAASEFERTASETEHGAGGPSLLDDVERSSALVAAAAAVADGGDALVGVGERSSESDVEMADA